MVCDSIVISVLLQPGQCSSESEEEHGTVSMAVHGGRFRRVVTKVTSGFTGNASVEMRNTAMEAIQSSARSRAGATFADSQKFISFSFFFQSEPPHDASELYKKDFRREIRR